MVATKIFKKYFTPSFFSKLPDQGVFMRASVLTRGRLCFMYVHKGSSMAKCNKVNQYMKKS